MKKHISSYIDRLKEISQGPYPMHMPGHKGNAGRFGDDLPYKIDTTEIKGAINLHHPDRIFKEKLSLLARQVGAEASFYSVNGSSGGIISCLHALCPRQSHILIERHAHQSVYHAIELLDLQVSYNSPYIDANISRPTSSCEIESSLKNNPLIKNVLITCPTYEGRKADLKAIADICHKYGALLIVDQAHGAHLRYMDEMDAVKAGADAVIESLHKTLPALTGSSLVHLSKRVKPTTVARYLSFFESSSPSHIIISSIDYCISYMQEEGKKHLLELVSFIEEKKKNLAGMENIFIVDPPSPTGIKNDPLKINIGLPYPLIDGNQAGSLLYDLGFEAEMLWPTRFLLMAGLGDEIEAIDRLFNCLTLLDKKVGRVIKNEPGLRIDYKKDPLRIDLPPQVYSMSRARSIKVENIKISESADKVILENIWAYPPGSPLLLAGEKISRQMLDVLDKLSKRKIPLHTDTKPEGSAFSELEIIVEG